MSEDDDTENAAMTVEVTTDLSSEDESSVEGENDPSYLSEFTDERLDYLMELERARIDSLNPLERWAEQINPFWTEQ